jgi:hypothetical protein
MQENANIFYYYYPPITGTSISSKNLKQTLLQEIDMAMMDNSRQESFRKNSTIRGIEISIIAFIRNHWDWKVKEIICVLM